MNFIFTNLLLIFYIVCIFYIVNDQFIKTTKKTADINDNINDKYIKGIVLYGDSYTGKLNINDYENLSTRDKIKQFKRHIEIPEISQESKLCDEGLHKVDKELVKCKISEKDFACWDCIESRKYIRLCLHFDTRIEYNLENGQKLIVEKNDDKDEGYCLPNTFKNSKNQTDIERQCNKNLGDWILSAKSTSTSASYNWLCKCKYPQLMDNKTNLTSNCTRMVACQGHGKLDDDSITGKHDPFYKGTCICEDEYKSDKSETIGPICSPRKFFELPYFEEITRKQKEKLVYKNFYVKSDSKLLSPYFNNKFSAVYDVLNPCSFDTITGDDISSCCELKKISMPEKNVKGRPQGERIDVVMCKSEIKNGCITTRSSHDFLNNNGGRYPNGCIKVTDRVETMSNTLLSYFNKANNDLPDEGVGLRSIKNSLSVYLNQIHHENQTIRKLEDSSTKGAENLFITKYSDFSWTFYNILTLLDFYHMQSEFWHKHYSFFDTNKEVYLTLIYETLIGTESYSFAKPLYLNNNIYQVVKSEKYGDPSGKGNSTIENQYGYRIAPAIIPLHNSFPYKGWKRNDDLNSVHAKWFATSYYADFVLPNIVNNYDNRTLMIVRNSANPNFKYPCILGESPVMNPFGKKLPKTYQWPPDT